MRTAFNTADVLAVLKATPLSLTTRHVLERCRLAAGLSMRGGSPDRDTRHALNKLENEGLVVSAKWENWAVYRGLMPPSFPYALIADPTDQRARWWATPELARQIVERVSRRNALAMIVREQGKLVEQLLAGSTVSLDENAGEISVLLPGDPVRLTKVLGYLAEALQRTAKGRT